MSCSCGCQTAFPEKPTLKKSLVPFTDRDSEQRGIAEVWWWDAITPLGSDRWRFLVVVDHIVTPPADGSQWIFHDQIDTFTYFGPGEPDCCVPATPTPSFEIPKSLGPLRGNYEVRSAIAARNPFDASTVSVTPVILTRQGLGDRYGVWFRTSMCNNAPVGSTTSKLTEDPERPGRYIASEDVHPGRTVY